MNFNYLSIGLLRFYRDDKGESLAERGVSTMRLPEAAKTGLRFLALVGFCNISYFIVYFLPYNWMAMQADTFPPYPSYMRYEIRSEEHTSELQSLMRISYAVFCLKKKTKIDIRTHRPTIKSTHSH